MALHRVLLDQPVWYEKKSQHVATITYHFAISVEDGKVIEMILVVVDL